MLKAYKYRLYPTDVQKQQIENHFGACRLIWNLALQVKSESWKSAKVKISRYELQKQLLELKGEYDWLYEINSQSLQSVLLNLDNSFNSFFRGAGYPKFKSKGGRQQFNCPQKSKIDFDTKRLTILKIIDIPIVITKQFIGKIKTVTISKTPTGKYYSSILVDNIASIPIKPVPTPFATIGIDVGIKSFAVISDGRVIQQNRKLKENLQRLKTLQRRTSRKKKGSNNRKKSNLKVALLYEKITNQRVDYCHKVTTELIRDNQTDTFVIEDLNVAGMLKNRKLSQAISDVSFGEFFRQLQYKCEWYGKNLIKIGRFEPSSKTCSDCGKINENLTLADRKWTCECGSTHDRDLNAAKNIKHMGLEKYSRQGMSGGPVELRRIRRAKKQENLLLIPK